MFRDASTADQSAVQTTESSVESPARMNLEIARGKTRYRTRPVQTDRFLIGSGRLCDLRLGGHGIPVIHSVIRHEGEDAWIDVLVPSPPLIVNNEIKHSQTLEVGDQIQIGCFEFSVRQPIHQLAATQRTAPIDGSADVDESILETQAEPQELSAVELVERIEREHEFVERMESGREMGATALLQAVAEHAARLSDEERSQDASLLLAIGNVLQELDRLHLSLQDQSASLEQRETSYANAASTLLAIQQRMAETLESMVQQMDILRNARAAPVQRIA